MVQPQYLDYWRGQQAKQRSHRQALVQEAWQEVRSIAVLLNQDFGATEVIVFGSLLSDRFDSQSDLDIAVAGLDTEQYWEALTAVNRLSQRWIDLKPVESLEPHFRDRVLARGQVVDAAD